MPSTLLILSDQDTGRLVARALRGQGTTVSLHNDAHLALGRLETDRPEVVVIDYDLPGPGGRQVLDELKAWDPDLGLVVVLSETNLEDVLEAVRSGADAFVAKPALVAEILDAWQQAEEAQKARRLKHRARRALDSQNEDDRGFCGMVGVSPPMRALYRAISRVAPSTASVLVCGESGTGKELVARAIHRQSRRSNGPLVSLNCAALAEGVLESELFGHEKGAFTGAVSKRQGRFEQADGGTLFLDEVSEIPASTQVKLLRVLQERSFERVGGNEPITIDVRIVAATNRDLPRLVQLGSFREDLFYRLNVVSLYVPALRERIADVPLLALHFTKLHATRNHKEIPGITDEAQRRLMAYPWPGNVRELENAVERAVVMAEDGTTLGPELFDLGLSSHCRDCAPAIPGASLADIERFAILKTLEMTGGSTTKAAKILGISVRKIQYRLKQYRIDSSSVWN